MRGRAAPPALRRSRTTVTSNDPRAHTTFHPSRRPLRLKGPPFALTPSLPRPDPLRIKRFQATDMRTALRMVRDEQGPDAVILSNRATADGIEVVAATDYDEALMSQALRAAAPGIEPVPAPAARVAAPSVAPAPVPDACQVSASASASP